MANTLYYAIGNNDVEVNGLKPINFREETHVALKEVNAKSIDIRNKRQIEFPIFDAVVKFLRDEQIHVDKLVFFATDQQPPNKQDTVFAVELLLQYAEQVIKPAPELSVSMIHGNPADYDDMFRHFSEFFEKNKLGEDDFAYMCIAAGTPAMSCSIVNAASLRPFQSELLYVPRGENSARRTEIAMTLSRRAWKDTVKHLVHAGQYSAAAETIENGPFREKHPVHILRALSYLENFCFEHAVKEYRKYVRVHPKGCAAATLKNYSAFCDSLSRPDDGPRLELLYAVMCEREKTSRVTDAVAMVFRFQEAVLIGWTERILKTKIVKDEKTGFENVYSAIEKIDGLSVFLEKETKSKCRSKEPNRFLYSKIVKYAIQNKYKDFEKMERAREFSNRLEKGDTPLANLRNEGPFAHGFRGVTQEDVKKVYGGDFLNDIKGFLVDFTGREPYNPFDDAEKALMDDIDNLH